MTSSHKTGRIFLLFITSILRGIRDLIIVSVGFVIVSAVYIFMGLQWVQKYLARKKLFVFVLLLLLGFGFFSLIAIIPSTHNFEGNLIVEEMSFIYNDQQPQLFLSSIRQISNLESEGIQTMTFTGKFQSESLPQLNELNRLTIDGIDSRSQLIISPVKKTSEIDLTELRLQPNTKVLGLSYDFYRQRLGFSLQPETSKNVKNKPNILRLNLGNEPVKVTLVGYKLPGVNLPNNSAQQTPREFIFTPNNQEVKLEIWQNSSIYLTTATVPSNNDDQWFRGQIKTKDVQFEHLDRNVNIRDDLAISTIIEGKIRMVEQEREIKTNQFIMGKQPDIPLNIELIRQLQIVPKKGLEVRIAGRTEEIKIGLDKNYPVSSIQGSWLDGILPRDAIIALFSFGAATIIYLLSFLVDKAAK
ncbi:MAG: hypothetical protein KA716_17215 [Gloeotrichia echinulata DEX184]|nr:hypothetical protein [Gloeotrichia echinulata DEX184]